MSEKLKRPDEAKGVPHHELPVGRMVSAPLKGKFMSLPLFGWVAKRDKTDTPLVMLVVVLIRSGEDPKPRGTLQIELPVFDHTATATVAALERYGWDGRIYPVDEGWPAGHDDEETQILDLMETAGLRATFVFPPGEQGASAQEVNVERAAGPFLMPPLPEAESVDPKKLERLQQLCENPRVFFRPIKPAVVQ